MDDVSLGRLDFRLADLGGSYELVSSLEGNLIFCNLHLKKLSRLMGFTPVTWLHGGCYGWYKTQLLRKPNDW